MKPSMLFPFFGLMLAVQAVQAAEHGGPTEPPVTHFQGTCDSDPDGRKFAERACYTDYNPGKARKGRYYKPPTCDKSQPVDEQQRTMLAKVYSRAPDYMKSKLCRLTQIFVTRANDWGPWGWGFWEGADRPPGKGVYVAISGHELATKQSIAEAENETVDRLVSRHGRTERSLLRLRSPDPADPELTVLGELAHELGHALLADSNGDGVDEAHPRRRISGPPQSACFEDAFIKASWDPDRFHRHMRRWSEFGAQYGNEPRNREVSLSRLRAAVRKGRIRAANDVISAVYDSREFAGPAAIPNPIEEVAETYKLKVLTDVAASSPITFQLKGKDLNLSDLLKSDVLSKKVECLRALGFLADQR